MPVPDDDSEKVDVTPKQKDVNVIDEAGEEEYVANHEDEAAEPNGEGDQLAAEQEESAVEAEGHVVDTHDEGIAEATEPIDVVPSPNEYVEQENDRNLIQTSASIAHPYQSKPDDVLISRANTDAKENFARTVEQESLKAKKSLTLPINKLVKRVRKGIFLSYSPDAGFTERKFVVDLVRQLKDNNLADDIWFDKDERVADSPAWFSLRMEAVEKCRAAIVILSDNYFSCPVSVYEGKTLIERLIGDPQSVHVFLVLFSKLEETEIPKQYSHLIPGVVDLTLAAHAKKSLAEKSSVVIGAIMEELEKFATINIPPPPVDTPDADFTGEFKKKKISQWTSSDLQEWLFKLGIKEFYRQSLAENSVDGFLLMSITDEDMIRHLSIDSRVVRKKIMQQILQTLDKEYKMPDNWHLRARTQRPRSNTVYLVYDPSDVRLAQSLRSDLQKKGLTVIHHQKLGQSKDEFLQINGPHMTAATHHLVVLTETASTSPFVFHEVLFGDWLGKKVLVAMFKNVWSTLRPALRAVLGDCISVDFESKLYAEGMDVLEHHFKPQRSIPGIVLEQSYLEKMAEGLRPLSQLVSAATEVTLAQQHQQTSGAPGSERLVYVSYHWDMQSKAEELRRLLVSAGFACWADVAPLVTLQRGGSSLSSRSAGSSGGGAVMAGDASGESRTQHGMRAAFAVLCCITPKYLQSDGCAKDLALADALHKPLIPVMLRYCPWPPEGAPVAVRKIFTRCPTPVIELYNDKLFKVNVASVVDRARKMVAGTVASSP